MQETPELSDLIDARLMHLRAMQPQLAMRLERHAAASLRRLVLVSDYVTDRLCRDPTIADAFDKEPEPPVLALDCARHWSAMLRRYRHAVSARHVWRDVNGIDRLEDTLAATSMLADRCVCLALKAVEQEFAQQHGLARSTDGSRQQLVVFSLGKHGGEELNFSSDIDLIFAYPEAGTSDGAHPLDNEIYFQRLGQRLIQLLGETTEEGFVYRVDMRLRPFGASGRLALSFVAMEHYYQREGRDWERYAWIKGRVVAGDIVAGDRLLAALRPFVYRRYLDYGAFDGLREMKTLIEAEVQRRELADHLKLGPGGIREIEFIVQLQQLIRGGREPDLRKRGLLPALALLRERGHLEAASANALSVAYRFLRRVENRLQMLREEQTHRLPGDALSRTRLAVGLGYPDWNLFAAELQRHRAVVAQEFSRVFEARRRGHRHADALDSYWRQIERAPDVETLAAAGFLQPAVLHSRLLKLAQSSAVRILSARTRDRLDRVLPALLAAAARTVRPDVAAERTLELLQAVLRRSSYLALLDEYPSALIRVVEVMAASAFMADRLCAYPLLLDDLLDARMGETPLNRGEIEQALAHALSSVAVDDAEARLTALNEFRQSQTFRIALATLLRRQPAEHSTRQLAWLAEAVIAALLPIVYEDLMQIHGRLPAGAGIAVLGYGSLGGKELSFGSDLDLVFLYDASAAEVESDGARPLDPVRYHARAVQRLIATLNTLTPAGKLYEVDVRLRPDGAKGLLVSSLQSFASYHRERAWIWEQQALVRARFVAGDPTVGAAFDVLRRDVLGWPRDPRQVFVEITSMRHRMREELDRTTTECFDLKQGEAGLVDLEFLLQAGVLSLASSTPDVMVSRRTRGLIDALSSAGWLLKDEAVALVQAHAELLTRALASTLDARPRLVPFDETLNQARAVIRSAWVRHELIAKSK